MQKKNYANQSWVIELVEAAESTVIGYENYLLDKIDHKELAKIVKNLKLLLPIVE